MAELNEMSGMEAANGSGNGNAAGDGQAAHAGRRGRAPRAHSAAGVKTHGGAQAHEMQEKNETQQHNRRRKPAGGGRKTAQAAGTEQHADAEAAQQSAQPQQKPRRNMRRGGVQKQQTANGTQAAEPQNTGNAHGAETVQRKNRAQDKSGAHTAAKQKNGKQGAGRPQNGGQRTRNGGRQPEKQQERKTELHWIGRGPQYGQMLSHSAAQNGAPEKLPLREQVDRMIAQKQLTAREAAQSLAAEPVTEAAAEAFADHSGALPAYAAEMTELPAGLAEGISAGNGGDGADGEKKAARRTGRGAGRAQSDRRGSGRNAAAQAQQRMLSAVAAAAAGAAAAETAGNGGTALSAAKDKAAKNSRRGKKKTEHVKIIPLGGLEQIGMNITAFEYKDSIIVVDCGMAFPEDDMLGIDLIIPDVTYLRQNIQKVKGFYITHGHEDHIGALPYILRNMNLPVYATRLTIALIENKLREAELLESAKLNIVSYGDIVEAGDFKVEFIKTNHSIQDAAALAIHSPAGVILHTGDFKVDYTPVFGDAIDLQRFAELGRQGVLALMADSTNALRPGFTMSERTVGRTFDSIFAEHANNRLIVATFASNVDRVQQIINDAEKYGRKVVVEGRSMVNVIGTAAELGYIKIKEDTLIDIAQLKDYPDEKTVLVTTGSQGESMAALSRMASGQHRKVTIGPNDVIVLSSNPIPGNEKAVSRVINELTQKHATVIYQDTHVSGHACQEELKLIYALVRPKFAIPIHGEYRHRVAQKEVAMSLGIPKENALIAETGDVIDLSEDGCKIVDKVQAGPLMVDGLGVGDVGNIVLHDRQNLGENGIIVVVLSLERYSGRLVSGPDIVSRGFVYVRENEDLMEEARLVVMDAVDDCLIHHVSDWGKIKTVIRDSLSDFIWRRLKRNPVILPIISEV